MNFKYIIKYSLDSGSIENSVGCHTESQAVEIAKHLHYGYNEGEGIEIDYIKIYKGDILMLSLDQHGNEKYEEAMG